MNNNTTKEGELPIIPYTYKKDVVEGVYIKEYNKWVTGVVEEGLKNILEQQKEGVEYPKSFDYLILGLLENVGFDKIVSLYKEIKQIKD